MPKLLRVSLLTVLILLTACEEKPKPPSVQSEPTQTPEPKPVAALSTEISAERIAAGRAQIEKFECNRCHVIEGVKPPELKSDCVGCHVQILDGSYEAKPEHLAKWQRNITGLLNTPSLVAVGARIQRDWLIDFLQSPHDLRPKLSADMPRMPISEAEAGEIADFLLKVDIDPQTLTKPSNELIAEGKKLTNEKGCWACHSFKGAEEERGLVLMLKGPGIVEPAYRAEIDPKTENRAMLLAPDLGHVSARFRADRLSAWLMDPAKIKPDTDMPNMGLSAHEADAIAAFLMRAKRKPVPKPEKVVIAGTHVGPAKYQAVQALFDGVCVHCHADPSHGAGDGGPGNTGGLGFAGKGLDLTSFSKIRKGSVRRKTGRSVVAAKPGSPSMLVVHLIERHNEVLGLDDPEVVGMPLGHAPLAMKDIELIHEWTLSGASPR